MVGSHERAADEEADRGERWKEGDCMNQVMTIEMRDGSVWAVPVSIIAEDRARYYASEFDGDWKRSLAEDTDPLFRDSEYEIKDWAVGNMNWSDVAHAAYLLRPPAPLTDADRQDAWNSGAKGIEVTA
jgi:hypothetical protein